METIEFKDAEKAKAARGIICRVAGEIVASYDSSSDATIERQWAFRARESELLSAVASDAPATEVRS